MQREKGFKVILVPAETADCMQANIPGLVKIRASYLFKTGISLCSVNLLEIWKGMITFFAIGKSLESLLKPYLT